MFSDKHSSDVSLDSSCTSTPMNDAASIQTPPSMADGSSTSTSRPFVFSRPDNSMPRKVYSYKQ